MQLSWLIAGPLLALWPGGASYPPPYRLPVASSRLPAVAGHLPASPADSVVALALALRGTRYCYAGSTPATGFDCSGFVRYVFGRYGYEVPHSTTLLLGVGQTVPRPQARPGDIVVFTGTDPASTSPGHAGIIVSAQGERPLRFVHASSAQRGPFVKVSTVEGSGYERRFMGIRRVL